MEGGVDSMCVMLGADVKGLAGKQQKGQDQ